MLHPTSKCLAGCGSGISSGRWVAFLLVTLASSPLACLGAEATATPELPSVGPSVVRLLGAFALVIALLLGGLWLARNGFRFNARNQKQRELKILEVRMLGQKQSLMVVGYQDQRLLLGSSPTGVNFITRLPDLTPEEQQALETAEAPPAPSFSQALQHALGQRA
ncbi:MAG: Flagellar biosynthesis protein FliO [Verrucomicrobiota bacterium]